MKTCKIALFEGMFRSYTGFLIAMVTRCQYVHAAVCVDGVWWHSSETLGHFGRVDMEAYKNRNCIVFEFPGDLTEWVEKMKPTRYDWRGVLGWIWKWNSPTRFYCFEAAFDALLSAKVIQHDEVVPSPSGCHLQNTAYDSLSITKMDYGKFGNLA